MCVCVCVDTIRVGVWRSLDVDPLVSVCVCVRVCRFGDVNPTWIHYLPIYFIPIEVLCVCKVFTQVPVYWPCVYWQWQWLIKAIKTVTW